MGRDMDGRVALEIFGPELAETPIRWVDTHDVGVRAQAEEAVDDPDMLERLRAVGYVQ